MQRTLPLCRSAGALFLLLIALLLWRHGRATSHFLGAFARVTFSPFSRKVSPGAHPHKQTAEEIAALSIKDQKAAAKVLGDIRLGMSCCSVTQSQSILSAIPAPSTADSSQ